MLTACWDRHGKRIRFAVEMEAINLKRFVIAVDFSLDSGSDPFSFSPSTQPSLINI